MNEDDRFNPAYYTENIDTDPTDAEKPIQKVDNNFVKYRKEIPNPNYDESNPRDKPTKFVTIELYGSYCTGTHIRSAVNGFRTPHIFGSSDEYLYFSVIDANGYGGRKDPLILFFDSPEQYEKHCHVTLSPITKHNWHQQASTYRSQ